ncbi:hypothetical protein V1283_005568 [Bradyrhizobium sp. AZCC 2262]
MHAVALDNHQFGQHFGLLTEMYRLRRRVFKDRLGIPWASGLPVRDRAPIGPRSQNGGRSSPDRPEKRPKSLKYYIFIIYINGLHEMLDRPELAIGQFA